jgi:hypothetical protein
MSIYTIVEQPLWWHKQGLQQTASGYGKKLTTPYCAEIDGEKRMRRVYCTRWGNAGSCWFMLHGDKVMVPDTAMPGDRWTLTGEPR